ncbi:hypothetical protein Tco_0210173 [Tanacetum coccineum]
MYDNSSPRPPEELNAEIAYTITESLFLPLIPVEDSDSRMEEIDLFLAFDDLMPPGIENDDYDSEGDIRFLTELDVKAPYFDTASPLRVWWHLIGMELSCALKIYPNINDKLRLTDFLFLFAPPGLN